jgi:hypothetical protein
VVLVYQVLPVMSIYQLRNLLRADLSSVWQPATLQLVSVAAFLSVLGNRAKVLAVLLL